MVYDIDYLRDHVQMILKAASGEELVADTASAGAQGILGLSFMLRAPVEATVQPGAGGGPGELRSVELRTNKSTEGEVVALGYDVRGAKCGATVISGGNPVDVTTASSQAQEVLEFSVRQNIPTGYLEYDAARVITRVKVNSTGAALKKSV